MLTLNRIIGVNDLGEGSSLKNFLPVEGNGTKIVLQTPRDLFLTKVEELQARNKLVRADEQAEQKRRDEKGVKLQQQIRFWNLFINFVGKIFDVNPYRFLEDFSDEEIYMLEKEVAEITKRKHSRFLLTWPGVLGVLIPIFGWLGLFIYYANSSNVRYLEERKLLQKEHGEHFLPIGYLQERKGKVNPDT